MLTLLFVSKGILKRTGGAETAAFQILRQIISHKDIKRIIVLTNDPKDTLKNKERINFSLNSLNKKFLEKIEIYCVPLIKPRIPIFTDFFDGRRFKTAIMKILKLKKIDLIHIHTYSAFYITPNISWNVPIIYTFNDFPIQWPNDPYNCFPINYVERAWTSVAKFYWKLILSTHKIYRSSLYFHCNGSDSKYYLQNNGINEENILLLPNGYEKSKEEEESYIETVQTKLKQSFDPHGQKLKILAVGQLNNIKNQYTLIKGFIDFSKGRDAILLIVGYPTPFIGPFYVRKIWKNLDLTSRKNIIWFGYVSNILLNELYKFTDLVVLMSHSEASPLILGECKKNKKTLISTRVGSLRELLPKELTMLNPNSSKSLSSELEKIYFNRQTLRKYEEAMNNTDLPLWDDVGTKLCDFYKTILFGKN